MKLISKIIIVVCVFFIGFIAGWQYQGAPQQPIDVKQKQEQKYANLMLDFGNGEVKTFNDIALEDSANVFDFVKNVTSENNIKFTYSYRC